MFIGALPRHLFLATLLAALLAASAASGQQSSPPTQPANAAIQLDVVVNPRSGPPVGDLQQQDFTLLDNKVPQYIASFRAVDGRHADVDVILVVDGVNADYNTVAFERDQIDKFLRADNGDLIHATSLDVLTDMGIESLADFSKDGNKLSASLDRYAVSLRFVNRSAGFYGATERLQLSLDGLHEVVQREANRPGRKLMIWISPGWPFLSGPEVGLSSKIQQQLYADVIAFSTDLLRNRITLYSIDPFGTQGNLMRASYWQQFLKGITKPSQALPGNVALQVLATQSGGVALYANNDIAALLQTCLADTRAYYEISFDLPAGSASNEYHRLEIRVAKHGLTARTRQGYYARPALGWEPMLPASIQKLDSGP
jgi:VWFA-related protein